MMDLKDVDLISLQNIKFLEKYNITTSKNLLEFYPYRYQVLNPSSLESGEDLLTINAKIVSMIVNPGNVTIHHASRIYCRPAESIDPHSGVGG